MRSSLPYNDHTLLRDLAQGNEKAFRLLFSQYRDAVYGFALHITHSAAHAEDITQDVFLKLWLHREKFAEVENTEAWIITITRNCCFNELKKTAREKCQELKPELQEALLVSMDKQIDDRDLLAKLHVASAQLTPKEQLVYRLNKEQGLRKEEIAKALNISHNTVKVHLANALRKIRHFVEGYSATGIFVLYILKNFF
ncbi:RNA polymerase sigma-70 factor [Lacibacter luteus]|uniref:RNA polymerase sigma-70 factor n=1 Tax=Lacibacter luteus TaxID=2508719 RepID=A0A4V1M7N4_9BACT|nr:RNA polymerase sigma-70 factor [Lacibacter luteus]RXK60685.1 RNA polymerase sigma-70 factor [Lacibacter luteus]